MRPARAIVVLVVGLAAAACDMKARPDRDQQAVEAGSRPVAVMAGEALDAQNPSRAPHAVTRLWVGRGNVECGVAQSGAAPIRFLTGAGSQGRRYQVEGDPGFDVGQWQGACQDQSNLLFPTP